MVPVTANDAAEKAKAVAAGTLPGPAKSLAEAMCRVMEQVSYVQKDKQMQGGGSYRYVSVEAVIDALRPEMIRQQLVLIPVAVDTITIESFENKNGTRQNRTQVKYTFKMLHAATGQHEPVVVIGEAIDVGDKSSNKCMTAARKYALIMAFNIETGLDPDDTPSTQQERAPARQAALDRHQSVRTDPKPAPPLASADNLEGRRQCEADINAIKDRAGLTSVYRAYDASLSEGRFSAADKAYLDGLFAAAGRKFPKPQPAEAVK